MLNLDDFNNLLEEVRTIIGEEPSALISEKLLNVISNYTLALDSINALTTENDDLKARNEELLKANAKLYEKIGYETKEEEKPEEEELEEENEDEEETPVEELINEKGEIV